MAFLNYFQIGAVVIVLTVIVTKALHSWAVTGVNPIVIGRGKGKWRIVEVLSFLALALWVTEVLLPAFRSRFDIFPGRVPLPVFETQATKILGVMIVTLGLVPFALAFISFGHSWRIGIDRQTPGSLVTQGIFRVTRNPIYVGFILFFAGIFLLNPTWFFLIFALLAVLAMHFQILREEQFLGAQYGVNYDEYRKRVPRYLFW